MLMPGPAWSRSQPAASELPMTLPPCGVDIDTWSSRSDSMPFMSGVDTACCKRVCTAFTSASLIDWSAAELEAAGDGSGETAMARRGLGLAPGTADGVLIGVGMGVLMLRVRVAAAPGTGVASGPSNAEQPALATATKARTTTPTALAQVIAQLLGSAGMPQLAKRLGLDLTDSLPSDAEFTTDFLQRTLASIVEPKSQGDDATFALGQRAKHVVHRVAQERLRRFLDGRNRFGVLNQIPKLTVLVVANRGGQTDGVARSTAGLHDALRRALELVAHRRLQPPHFKQRTGLQDLAAAHHRVLVQRARVDSQLGFEPLRDQAHRQGDFGRRRLAPELLDEIA